jgi:hypothetical protein
MAGLSQAIQQILTKLDNIEVKQKSIDDMFLDNFDHDFKPFDKEIEYVFDYNTKKIIKGTILLDNHLLVRDFGYFTHCVKCINDWDIYNSSHINWDFKKYVDKLLWLHNKNIGEIHYIIDNYCNIYIEKIKLYIKINTKQQPIIPHLINKNIFRILNETTHWDLLYNPNNESNLKLMINIIYYEYHFLKNGIFEKEYFNHLPDIVKEKLDFNKYKDKTINDSEYVLEMVEFLLSFINYGEKIKVFYKLQKN